VLDVVVDWRGMDMEGHGQLHGGISHVGLWMQHGGGVDVYCIITCKYSTAISFQKEARLMRGNESFLSSSLV